MKTRQSRPPPDPLVSQPILEIRPVMRLSFAESEHHASARCSCSRSEVVAHAVYTQCTSDRHPLTSFQYARSSGHLRAIRLSADGPLNDIRADAESSDPNKSERHIGSADEVSAKVLPLTLRQFEVLRAVEDLIRIYGYPPSLSELGAVLGSAKPVVVDHLKGLERKGFVRRNTGEHRGLTVLIASNRAEVMAPKPLRKVHLCCRCKREVG